MPEIFNPFLVASYFTPYSFQEDGNLTSEARKLKKALLMSVFLLCKMLTNKDRVTNTVLKSSPWFTLVLGNKDYKSRRCDFGKSVKHDKKFNES